MNEKCENYRETITAFVLGELDTDTSAEVRQHLENCSNCQNFHDALEKQEQTIISAFDTIKLNTDPLESNILNQLQCQAEQPRSKTAAIFGHTMKGIEKMIASHKRMSAATAACAVVGITLAVIFLTVGNGGASITWADVQQHIRNTRTMTVKVTMEMKSLLIPDKVEMKMMFKESGLMRIETTTGPLKHILIMDMQKNKGIMLMKEPKEAFVLDLTELPDELRKKHKDMNFLGEMKKLIEESETELGEKQINGRTVKGYRVEKSEKQGKVITTIWADAKTAKPVEINITGPKKGTKMSMSDFKFGVELDESLFSLDIPKGYTDHASAIEKEIAAVKKKMAAIEKEAADVLGEASVEDMVEMFRIWVKAKGGTFPDVLTQRDFMMDIEPSKLEDHVDAMVLITLHREAYYAGKGVKFGEANKPVFWYKPTDSETYKVIYGDLSVKDVAEKDLPSIKGE